MLIEPNDEHLDYSKNEEQPIIEKISEKSLEVVFSNMFEDICYGKILNLPLSPTDPDKLKQKHLLIMKSKFHEIKLLKS